MMTVVYVNTLYFPNEVGGAERVLRSLAEYTLQQGHRPVVITLDRRSEARVEELEGVRIYYMGLANIYWPFDDSAQPVGLKAVWHALNSYNPVMARKVEEILEEEDPDLVHTHNLSGFSASVWPIAGDRGVPVVHTVHDYQLVCVSSMYRNGRNCRDRCVRCRGLGWPRRRLSVHVDAVTGCSQHVLERHRRAGYFPEADGWQAVPNFHDLEIASDPSGRDSPGQREWRLGYIGRLRPEKGVEWMLESLDSFKQVRHDWEIRVAGTGEREYETRLKERFRGEYVSFCGHVDPTEFLDGIDVLVVPSLWHEPFGIVVVEAFARGVPVVAASRGGIPEVVSPGDTGLLFDPGNPTELHQALDELLEHPDTVERMARNAVERAEEFTTERILPRYLKVYDRVIA